MDLGKAIRSGKFTQEVGVMPVRFIITGTHAYGPANGNSDLDVLVSVEDGNLIKAWLGDKDIDMYQTGPQTGYPNGGFYFNLAFIRVNIIMVHDRFSFDAWEMATEAMKKKDPIYERDKRLRTFNDIMNGDITLKDIIND